MALGLNKSLIIYLRRLAALAAAAGEEKLNAQEVHEFDVGPGLRFDPSFFPGFFDSFPEKR